jgi:peptidyl-prolyl cis-trans isomerase D
MGYLKRNDPRLPQEVLNAIFYDHKSGDMFTVETGGGLFLTKIVQTGGSKEAAKVAFLTKNVEPSEATINATYAKAQQLAGANRSLDALKKAAEAEKLPIKSSTDLESSSFRIDGLGIADEIVKWAFQNSANTVSDRVFKVDTKLPDGRITSTYVVAAVAKAKAEGMAQLDDVRERLTTEVKKQKKGEQLIAKLGANTDLAQIAAANSQEVQNAADISFGAPHSKLDGSRTESTSRDICRCQWTNYQTYCGQSRCVCRKSKQHNSRPRTDRYSHCQKYFVRADAKPCRFWRAASTRQIGKSSR